MEQLYDLWKKRHPKWETRFQKMIEYYTEFGTGSTSGSHDKAKKLGAGYEMYIYAYFLGLYHNRRRELVNPTKDFSHAVGNWEGKDVILSGRKKYPDLKEYIFATLIAKADNLDFIGLEKGEVSPSKIIDNLMLTMQEYANFGFILIADKLAENPGYFDTNAGFLNFLLDAVSKNNTVDNEIEEL